MGRDIGRIIVALAVERSARLARSIVRIEPANELNLQIADVSGGPPIVPTRVLLGFPAFYFGGIRHLWL
jgi:hypothetical protein